MGCAIFAAVSGSSAATAATIGRMSVPELTRRGYSQSLILGTLAGSATLGLLIPPSLILIVYGVATEQSIARLFVAGILPGLMLVGLFAGYVAVLALRNPAQFPADGDRLPLREKLAASRRLIPVMLLIAGVIGTIYTGVASPTDAAAIGVVLLLVLAVSSGGFGWDALSQVVGIDPLWFGIYLVLVVEMSQITPPVGFNLFVIQGLTGIDILRVARAAFPFFLLLLLGVVLITVFPQIVTVLPNAMGR
jgi:TRAP-type C4-dicarboxylate transport system permease large subunit